MADYGSMSLILFWSISDFLLKIDVILSGVYWESILLTNCVQLSRKLTTEVDAVKWASTNEQIK